MSFLICPYTGKPFPAEKATPEHIIPLSIGGHNAFVIPASAEGNSKAGDEIDGKFANNPLIMMTRMKFDLRGHSGSEPTLKSNIQKLDMPMGEQDYRLAISRSKGIQVTFVNIKQPIIDPCTGEQTGFRFVYNDEKQKNAIRQLFQDTSDPSIEENSFSFDTLKLDFQLLNFLDVTRECIKIALAFCCFHFGNNFAGSLEAARLRKAIWSTSFEEMADAHIRGDCWPHLEMDELHTTLQHDDDHVVSLIKDSSQLVCYILLFGNIPAKFEISNKAEQFDMPGDAIVTYIDFKNNRIEHRAINFEYVSPES